MPIVAVTTWPTPDAVRRKLLRELTETVHTVTGAPRHKITVHITEINPGQWAEAGIPGDDPSFPSGGRDS
jgi:phenylpyruvate tautomerase PptA (4-oxalocrotonate tautomerase family)